MDERLIDALITLAIISTVIILIMIYFIKESKKYDQSSENSSSMELENRNVSSHSHYETSRTVSFNSMPMAYDVIYAQSSSVNPARKAQIPPEDSPPSYDEALRRVKPIKI